MSRRRENEVPALSTAFHAAWDSLRSDYAAGTNSRFRPQPPGVSSMGSGADYHYANETAFLRMIERARFFDRNNMIVGQAVNRLVANVVQDGFPLEPMTGDKNVDNTLWDRFQEWGGDADRCDFEREKCWTEIEQLTLRHIIVDGDVLNLPIRDDSSLQAFEAHRLRTPRNTSKNVVHGVHLDENARRMEYWLTKADLSPLRTLSRVRDIEPYKARGSDGSRQVFHSYFPWRFSQRRGVTALAPIVDAVGIHDDLQFANLVKAQVASCFAIFEEYASDAPPPRGGTKTGETKVEEQPDGSTRTIEGVSPGMRVKGTQGMKLHGFSPNIPNPEFFPHAMMILTFIAINLDLPVAVLLLDPTRSNFSAWRGAVDQARMRFKVIQKALARRLHTPVYRFLLNYWMSEDPKLRRDAERLGKDFFKHAFHCPAWDYIEPLKDAMADDMQVTRNLTSMRRLQAKRGRDWDVVSAEIVDDRVGHVMRALKGAADINTAHPEAKIDWRELAYGQNNPGVTVKFNSDLGETDSEGQANE